jgi:aspartyl aminopeptidase
VYGGPILNTWLDRPLSAAGRVIVKGEHPFYPVTKLIHIEQPILMIPNLAIHMNRKVNEGIELNKQKDLLPILGIIDESFEKNNYLLKYLGDVLHMDAKDIIDFDLFLYPVEKSCIMGMNDEFISAPRLDDLAMVHAGIKAICAAKPSRGINVMVCFDNEEIGSSTQHGADSPMLSSVLERIVLALGQNREGYFRSLAHSFMISADMAHAIHPNYIEKQDPTNHPRINEGPVIKISANQKYTTDSYSDSVYEQICRHADIPVQKFVNRSDQPGGSTIGPINAAHMNIRSIDIGNPMLGMHSVRELAGVKDHTYIIKSFESFFEI